VSGAGVDAGAAADAADGFTRIKAGVPGTLTRTKISTPLSAPIFSNK